MSINIRHNSIVNNERSTLINSDFELVNWPTAHSAPLLMSEKVLAFQTTCNSPKLHKSISADLEIDKLAAKDKMPFGHFNLGLHVGDSPQQVIANRNILTQFIKQKLAKENTVDDDIDGSEVKVQWLEQVHGNHVAEVITVKQQAMVADASITRNKNIALAVMTADCLPILLSAINGEEIAAIHGGWRPLAANIIEKTLEKMLTKPKDIVAWLGPCIGKSAFEVGSEVKDCFIKQGEDFENAFVEKSNGKFLADLHNIAELQLNSLGIKEISYLPECTYENTNKYYSYRKRQITGRMATIICRC